MQYDVIETLETADATIDVLQARELAGSSDARSAEQLFFVSQAGMRLKKVRIKLRKSKVRVEPGALYFMHGDLKIAASTGGGLVGPKRITPAYHPTKTTTPATSTSPTSETSRTSRLS